MKLMMEHVFIMNIFIDFNKCINLIIITFVTTINVFIFQLDVASILGDAIQRSFFRRSTLLIMNLKQPHQAHHWHRGAATTMAVGAPRFYPLPHLPAVSPQELMKNFAPPQCLAQLRLSEPVVTKSQEVKLLAIFINHLFFLAIV